MVGLSKIINMCRVLTMVFLDAAYALFDPVNKQSVQMQFNRL